MAACRAGLAAHYSPKGAPRLMAPAEAAGALLLVLAEVSLVAVTRDVIV